MIGLLVVIVLVAGLASAAAFALNVLAPKMRSKRRTLIAAFFGAMVPMSIPIVALMFAGESMEDAWLPVFVVVVLGVILAAAIGFPAAYWTTKHNDRFDPDVFH